MDERLRFVARLLEGEKMARPRAGVTDGDGDHCTIGRCVLPHPQRNRAPPPASCEAATALAKLKVSNSSVGVLRRAVRIIVDAALLVDLTRFLDRLEGQR